MQLTDGIPLTTAEDMGKARKWAARFLDGPDSLPITFGYGGKPVHGIPADWQPTSHKRRIDANLV